MLRRTSQRMIPVVANATTAASARPIQVLLMDPLRVMVGWVTTPSSQPVEILGVDPVREPTVCAVSFTLKAAPSPRAPKRP